MARMSKNLQTALSPVCLCKQVKEQFVCFLIENENSFQKLKRSKMFLYFRVNPQWSMSRTAEQTYRECAADQAGSPFRIWISRYNTTGRNHSNGCSAAILTYLMAYKGHCFRTVGMLFRKKSIKLRCSQDIFATIYLL